MAIIQKDKDPILDQKFFDLLFPIIFPIESQNEKLYNFCKNKLSDEMKLLSTGSLLEQAISTRKKLTRHNTIGKDFVDGSDAKSASVRWSSNNTHYGAPIHDIYNKKGLLRCVIYERLHDKFYYFLIPHEAYKNIPKSSNIEIPFNLDGTPKMDAKRIRNINWWQFEVSDFDGILEDVANPFEFEKVKKEKLKQERKALALEKKASLKLLKASSPKKRYPRKTKIVPNERTSIVYMSALERKKIREIREILPTFLSEISLSELNSNHPDLQHPSVVVSIRQES